MRVAYLRTLEPVPPVLRPVPMDAHRLIAQSARLLPYLVATFLAVGTPARAQISFQHVVVDPAGPQGVWGKSIGDLNHDGLPDLIAGGRDGGGLVWYENPSWAKRTIAASGAFSTDHEVCDVDLDGDNDVVSLQDQVYWYEAPSWTEHLLVGNTLHDIEVFDFDGDGDCDVAGRDQGSFGSGGGATLYLYTQSSPSSWIETAIAIPDGEGLTSADLDGDEDLDLVVNEVWLENPGADLGSWTQHVYTTTWDHKHAYVAVADMDRDGNPDVLLSPAELQGGNYRISWLEAPDDPKQPAWTEHIVDGSVETVHHFVGAGDFDRDGDIDVASAEMQQGSGPDNVTIYRNDGAAFAKIIISENGSHSMRVVDVDLDGDLDLYGANWEDDQVDLFLNETPPAVLGLDAWQRRVLDGNRPGTAIFIAADDLDGDNDLDVAAGGYWYRNPGSAAGVWPRAAFGYPLNNLAVLDDLDNDGDTDVLGTEGVDSEAAPDFVYGQNDGSGNFTLVQGIASGNGDFLQGVTVDRLSPGERKRVVLSWHSGPALVEALVVPDDPATQLWTLETLANTSQQEALSHGDIDRDGDQDLLLGTDWLENNGSSFARRTLFQTDDYADRNSLADIDRDGRLDAVVGYEAISTTGVVAWYRQPASPTGLWSETIIGQVVGPMSVDVADMDRDGDLDVVVGEHDLSNPSGAGLFIFENLDGAGGSWTQHTVHVGDEHHDGAQVVDIDRDGDFDILSIGWGHGRVLLYENLASAGGTSTAACSDGLDNDNDGLVDFPEDPGCSDGSDTNESSGGAPGLLAAWGFGGSGQYVADNSGEGHTGVLASGASRSADGYFGPALETDGVAGHVDLSPIDIASDELTLMAWVNADDFGTLDARILSKSAGTAADDHVWMLSTIDGPHARFRLKTDDGGATTTLVGTGDSLVAGTWHHVAATYDGATMRLYQDGNEVGSVSKTGAVFQDPSVDAYIAANPGSSDQVFDGRIDDVKLFGRALTRAEIANEMATPAAPASEEPPDSGIIVREGCYLDVGLGKVLCPRSCSAGPVGRHESDLLLWAALLLLGLAARRRTHTSARDRTRTCAP